MKTKTKTKNPCLSLQVYLAGINNSTSKKKCTKEMNAD